MRFINSWDELQQETSGQDSGRRCSGSEKRIKVSVPQRLLSSSTNTNNINMSVADTASERETPLHHRSWAGSIRRVSPSLSHAGDATSTHLPVSTTISSDPPQ
ncbi:unnamed protein product [Pleuronectes platessa]|uniref:Uncharacterized protein n=1 Tax=Pleuronectes platessa TaxID=8262 RepID=A0A9N7VNF0_PLEPL|nr:unnamed protein product [Pleuronectes platessa]